MAKRSSKPLYELMSTRRVRHVPGDSSEAVDDEPVVEDAEATNGGLARTIRVPTGWLLVAGAGLLLLLVGAYAVGFRFGGDAKRDELDQEYVEGMRAEDPVLDTQAPGGPTPAMDDPGASGRPSGIGGAPAPSEPRAGTPSWPTIDTDPRESGRWYVYVAASSDREGLREIARFFRDHGVQAHVVGRGTLEVVVLPSYASSSAAQAMVQRVRDLGSSWIRAGGSRNFEDAYPRRYD